MRRRQLNTKTGFIFRKLLMQNIVVGCTIAGNKALLNVLNSKKPNTNNIVMHDWWLALIASVFGKITYIEKSLILYRQHGKNCVGAKPSGLSFYMNHLLHGKPFAKTWNYIDFTSLQAREFYSQYGVLLSEEQKKQIAFFLDVRGKNVFTSLLRCFFKGISMHSFKRNLALLICFSFIGRLPLTNEPV
jgi:hypothetical protein